MLSRAICQFIRHKHAPDHWSVLRKKIHPKDKALTHFDDFYKQVFSKQWVSIREGLLADRKYVAVVNNFSDPQEIATGLELKGALNIRRLFEIESDNVEKLGFKAYKHMKLKPLRQKTDKPETQLDANPPQFSLEASLQNAEIDEKRLIDENSEILYEFVPATEIKGMDDFIPESDHYKYYQTDRFEVRIVPQYKLHFPEHLNIFCFEEDNLSTFEPCGQGSTGVLNYYLMDGSSILPVLALDIQLGDKVLDLCAAPGGKSLLAMQTLLIDSIVCNDISASRTKRLHQVANQFLYDLKEKWLEPRKLQITNIDGAHVEHFPKDRFDKILVDVPCTTDRHSLHENDNNIFKPSRIKERLSLPEVQCDLLVTALKLVKIGGIVVYSTCSLSPIQNDGVVHMALKRVWEETQIDIHVVDMGPALVATKNVFKFAKTNLMKYGHLVLPHLSQNYGPTYFCKLKRIQ